MPDAITDPTPEELKAFAAFSREQFAEKCAYFHEHPNLAKVYRAIHFPKPEPKPQPITT
jgi:hypothetical protein